MANFLRFGGKPATGNAVAGDLLSGKTATTAISEITGTMPNIGAQNITPSTSNQTISAGYHNGSGVVYGDADLVAGNIAMGKNIFNIVGTAVPRLNVASPNASTTCTNIILGTSVALYSFTTSSGTNAAGSYSWSFQGSPNNSTWTTLASGSQPAPQSAGVPYNTAQSYTLSNNTSYLYFKLVFTPSSLNWDATRFYVSFTASS